MIAEKNLTELYRRMLRIRRVEEAIVAHYPKQQMRCPVHLSIGQEAAPAALSLDLTDADRVYSSHRCHAHYLAKLGATNKMIAELLGKTGGCSKGKGGSMHLVDVERGMMGSSALVSGSIPLAVGSAFSFKLSGEKSLAVAYFGDGGSEEGILYECLNFAALKKLPVIFACENNNYATYSPQKARQSDCEIFKRGEAFGVPGLRVDGYDLPAVLSASRTAVERARSGGGPTLLEFTTCRWFDHVGPSEDFEVGYRTQAEVEAWKARCPLAWAESQLPSETVTSVEAEILKEIEAAFTYGDCSPLPALSEMFEDIYA
ncbi:MAG: thiamine pyrophosphate-dependent dehydrogenase E1 component subunit alpha [Bdellovibrionales bacterium]|nr:thiamine pyrophosphate-dependent dehydrogenase E1 component subunit alpha [Bdellovibrionales bacterium]